MLGSRAMLQSLNGNDLNPAFATAKEYTTVTECDWSWGQVWCSFDLRSPKYVEVLFEGGKAKPAFLIYIPCASPTSLLQCHNSLPTTFIFSTARIAELAQFALFVLLLCCGFPLFCAHPQNPRSSNLEAEDTKPSRIATRSISGYKNVAYFVNWYTLNSCFASQSVEHTYQ